MKFRKEKQAPEAAPGSDATTATCTGIEKADAGLGANGVNAAKYEHDLSSFADMHSWDPNLDPKKLHAISDALEDRDVQAEAELERELEDNSPYPEVRAAVQNWDQDELPANTIRAWILGMFFVTLGSGMNMLFSLRAPTIAIGMLVVSKPSRDAMT